MKKLLFVAVVLLALAAQSQADVLLGQDTSTATAYWNFANGPAGDTPSYGGTVTAGQLTDATGNGNNVTYVGASPASLYWTNTTDGVNLNVPGDGWALYGNGSAGAIKYNQVTGSSANWSYINTPPVNPVSKVSGDFQVFMRINPLGLSTSGVGTNGNANGKIVLANWLWGNTSSSQPNECRGFEVGIGDADNNGQYGVLLQMSGGPGTKTNRNYTTEGAYDLGGGVLAPVTGNVQLSAGTWYDILISYHAGIATVQIEQTGTTTIQTVTMDFSVQKDVTGGTWAGYTDWNAKTQADDVLNGGNMSIMCVDFGSYFNGYVESLAVFDTPEPATMVILLGGALLGLRRRK